MRKYNNVAITKIANPNIVKQFGSDVQTIVFEPKKKPICVKEDGTKEEFTDSIVKFTVNYCNTSSELRSNICGPHVLVMFDFGYIVMDLKQDVCLFV